MNQLIPKYSFIKLFLPRVKEYNSNIYINHNHKRYADIFTQNDMKVNITINIREDYVYNHKIPITNYYFVNTHIQLLFQDKKIDELIQINHSDNHFKINYELKNNDIYVEKIDLPKFKVENNNHKLLLENYKFLDKIHNNEDYHKLFIDIQKDM